VRPKALKANRTLTPLETAELLLPPEVLLGAGEVRVEEEAGVELGEELRVIPTARHISTAAAIDLARSSPEQLVVKQTVVLATNSLSLHKHLVSLAAHVAEVMVVKQGRAQLA
jgi:hypothetical protein